MNEIVNKEPNLQLCPIQISEDYAKKWNEHMRDFLGLTNNGQLISENLYRVGGFGTTQIQGLRYFTLLKYTEAFYGKEIMERSKTKDPKHLQGNWVIIDKYGVEKVVIPQFDSCYIVKDSCIYSIKGKYYNIETGEFYCNASTSMETSEFLFLDNKYDMDKSKRGVFKISKLDGSFEILK